MDREGNRPSSEQKICAVLNEELDRDLDRRLDAAVFRSDDVLPKSQKDNRRSKEFLPLSSSNERNSVCRDNSSAIDLTRVNFSEENLRLANCSEESRIDDLGNSWKNLLRSELVTSNSETDFKEICDDRELTNFVYREGIYKEIVSQFDNDRKNDSRREGNSTRSDIMKRQTSWQCKFDFYDKSNDAAVNFDSNSASSSAKVANESSDVKTEEEPLKVNSPEKLARISLFGTSVIVPEENLNVSVIPKPEEVPGESEFVGSNLLDKDSAKVAVCAEKNLGDHCDKIEAHFPPVSVSSSFLGVVEMSSSSSSDEEYWGQIAKEKADWTKAQEWSNVVTINDSEDSICEIPVPPKPEPPTVYLEDSSESMSSSSDMEYSGAMSGEKSLPGCSSGDQSRVKDKGGLKPSNTCLIETDATSSSGSSTTDVVEESWGIMTGSEISKERNLPSLSDDDVSMSKVPEDENRDSSLESTAATGSNSREKSGAAVEKSGKTAIGESPGSSKHSEATGEIRSGEMVSLEKSPSLGKPCDGAERFLCAIRQAALAYSERNYGAAAEQNIIEDGALILNVAEANRSSGFVENSDGEMRTKARENRKRSIVDSGIKSNENSPVKKSRNSDDRAEAGTSSDKSSCKENKENRDKRRSCTADYFFQPMNNEMKNFYNNSWGGENFDVDALRKKMPRDPRQWSISNDDLLGSPRRRSRYWTQMKCRNCNETGHKATDCTQDNKVPSCHMCGAAGHREPRCPHKQCLGCGKKQKTYMPVCNGCRRAWCSGCQSLGHEAESCPDLWRRYHLTTSITEVNTDLSIADVMKPQHLLSCCNCAQRGHESANCNSYRWSRHFPTPAHVTNYNAGPDYQYDFAPEDNNLPPEPAAPPEIETQATDAGSSLSTTLKKSGNHEKKKKDKQTSNRPTLDPNVGELAENRDASLGGRDGAEKNSESSVASSKTTESRNIVSLKFESKLLTEELKKTAGFATWQTTLSLKQYKSCVNCDFTRQFFTNLTLQFPINVELRRTKSEKMKLFTYSTKDLHNVTRQLIFNWLKYPVDERSRFVNLNLPTNKEELVKLVASKLGELNDDLGDPVQLYDKVQSLKSQLRSMQQQIKAGKKSGSSPKRARIVDELANLECRLNMILFGQPDGVTFPKSPSYLMKTLAEMRQNGSQSDVDAALYLQIVIHYNKIFAAYTPMHQKYLIQQFKRRSKKKLNSKKPTAVVTPRNEVSNKRSTCNSYDKTYVDFIQSVIKRPRNKKRDYKKSLSSTISPKVPSAKSDKNSRRYFSCNVENQFQPPIVGSSDKNRDHETDLRTPKPQTETQHDSRKRENDDYNCKYDLRNSSKYQTQSYAAGPKNREHKDYISLNCEPRDSEKTADNRYEDLRSESKPFYQNEGAQQDHGNEEPANVGFGEMFYVDKEAGSSQDFGRNESGVISSRKVEAPATTAGQEHKNADRGAGEQKSVRKKHRKRNKIWTLPHYLQKRAADKVEKYSNFGHVDITRAASIFQKKFKNNTLTMQCIYKFEKLLMRCSGVKDHLL